MSVHLKSLVDAEKTETRTIPAGEFKAKCLALLDDVDTGALELLVTKRGKPVARVVAPQPQTKPFVSLFGRSPNVRVLGDIYEKAEWPDPIEKWDRMMAEEKAERKEKKEKKGKRKKAR